MTEKKRGGLRSPAGGRPRKEPTAVLSFRVPEKYKDIIKQHIDNLLKNTIMSEKKADAPTPSQTIASPQVICRHEEICVFTEIPTDGIVRQQEKVYIKCLLCDEVLPIRVILQRTIEVPLYDGT